MREGSKNAIRVQGGMHSAAPQAFFRNARESCQRKFAPCMATRSCRCSSALRTMRVRPQRFSDMPLELLNDSDYAICLRHLAAHPSLPIPRNRSKKTTKVNHSPSLCPRPLNAEKPLPAPLLALLQLPAVSMRLNLHFALCCKCAQVEVMLRRCVFFQHRNRDTFGGAIPSTFGQDLSVRSL